MRVLISITWLLVLIIWSRKVALADEHVALTAVNPAEIRLDHDRVRSLRVRETVHLARSYLEFTWDVCHFCNSYELVIRLSHYSLHRVLKYELKANVNSFTTWNLLPRTKYHLEIKTLPSDATVSSTVEGVTFCDEAPPPVRDLVVRPLTNTSLHARWLSEISDGSLIKVVNNDILVQEKILSFGFQSNITIEGLDPDTEYEVQVIAFFEPKSNRSSALTVASQQRTLPSELPDLQFQGEDQSSDIKLQWNNSKWPCPVSHQVACYAAREGPRPIIKIDLSGSNNLLVFKSMSDEVTELNCTLTTWFSSDPWAQKTHQVIIRRQLDKPNERQSIRCYDKYYSIRNLMLSVSSCDEQKNQGFKSNSLRIQFNTNTSLNHHYVTATNEYQLCRDNVSCLAWVELSGHQSVLTLGPGNILPWTSYILKLRTTIRAQKEELFQLPQLGGIVPPVSSLKLSHSTNSTIVSWTYATIPEPDYFLLTKCISGRPGQSGSSSTCSATSLPHSSKSATLTSLENGCVYYISIQTGKMHRDTIIQSEPRAVSFYVPSQAQIPEKISLSTENNADSQDIQVKIDYKGGAELSKVTEYHVNICGTRLPIWDEEVQEAKFCKKFTVATENATFSFSRLPWTEYVITVDVCYGVFDSTSAANITLPTYQPAPVPLAGVDWDEDKALLSWRYRSYWEPSGFIVSFCKSREDPIEGCSNIETGRRDRYYQVNPDDLPSGDLIVLVTPFVNFKGSYIEGPRSELVLNRQHSNQQNSLSLKGSINGNIAESTTKADSGEDDQLYLNE
ncbi:uncharacterized protein LOC111248243 isoform X2 [Varroa destructor]|uniref:Fibronectin type-III domain-containing protein n=1 Tax=Varroa destructor TaxID=109461 RepID=A0A7M7MEF3_VARDE|nr:uncharacterized protein LOC111248243 isoform X2 [Varroa destructor]